MTNQSGQREDEKDAMCICGHDASRHEWNDEISSCCLARVFPAGSYKLGEGNACMCEGFLPAPSKPLPVEGEPKYTVTPNPYPMHCMTAEMKYPNPELPVERPDHIVQVHEMVERPELPALDETNPLSETEQERSDFARQNRSSNYICDRDTAPEWVCFANGRTVGIAWENSKPYLNIGWEQKGEKWLRTTAAAEDDAGCINIGDPAEAVDILSEIAAELPADENIQEDMLAGHDLFWKLTLNDSDYRKHLVKLCRQFSTRERQLLAAQSELKTRTENYEYWRSRCEAKEANLAAAQSRITQLTKELEIRGVTDEPTSSAATSPDHHSEDERHGNGKDLKSHYPALAIGHTTNEYATHTKWIMKQAMELFEIGLRKVDFRWVNTRAEDAEAKLTHIRTIANKPEAGGWAIGEILKALEGRNG